MKLTINYHPNTKRYYWDICDGPDGIDESFGHAETLGEVFEQVTIWRYKIYKQYE